MAAGCAPTGLGRPASLVSLVTAHTVFSWGGSTSVSGFFSRLSMCLASSSSWSLHCTLGFGFTASHITLPGIHTLPGLPMASQLLHCACLESQQHCPNTSLAPLAYSCCSYFVSGCMNFWEQLFRLIWSWMSRAPRGFLVKAKYFTLLHS